MINNEKNIEIMTKAIKEEIDLDYWVARNSAIHFNTTNTINTILRKNKAIKKVIEELDNIEEKLWLISLEADDYTEPLF